MGICSGRKRRVLVINIEDTEERLKSLEETFHQWKAKRFDMRKSRHGSWSVTVNMKNMKPRMFWDFKEVALWKDFFDEDSVINVGKSHNLLSHGVHLKDAPFLLDEINYYANLELPPKFEKHLLYCFPTQRMEMETKHHEIFFSKDAVSPEDSKFLLDSIRNIPTPTPECDERFRRKYIDPDDMLIPWEESYCWKTVRMVLTEGRYQFQGGVHASLTEGLEKIFNSLWPALKQSMYLQHDPVTLEVIPKVCEYELPPGILHEGVWHGEGTMCDEIVAAAVHYLHVDSEIKGGELRFRPCLASYSSFAGLSLLSDFDDAKENLKIMVSENELITQAAQNIGGVYFGKEKGNSDWMCPTETNTSVVFNNIEVRHKVETFSNEDSTSHKRSFVAFFIVSPDQSPEKIQARSLACGPYHRESWVDILEENFPRAAARVICEFASLGFSEEDRQSFRSKVDLWRKRMGEQDNTRYRGGRYGDMGDWAPVDAGYALPIMRVMRNPKLRGDAFQRD